MARAALATKPLAPMMRSESKPIKVLHVFGKMDRGGAEMRTVDVMRHLDREAFPLHYCSLSGLAGDLDSTIRSLGGEVHLISIRAPSFPWRFIRLLRREKYDVVHSHVHFSSGFILMIAAASGVRERIAHFRNTDDGRGNSVFRQFHRWLMRALIHRFATSVLAVSHAAMEQAWRRNGRSDARCRVIYNGLDSSAFADATPDTFDPREEFGLPRDAVLYIHVGRFAPAKNHDRVLAIFAEIVATNAKAYLLLVGRGDNAIEARVRASARCFSWQKQVIFTGVREDVPSLLQSADLLLFPSLREGLPGAVIESCAAGTPVLASDLPVIREIADFFPSVRLLSLDADSSTWANAAEQLRLLSAKPTFRAQVAETFEASPFSIERTVSEFQHVWMGGDARQTPILTASVSRANES